MSTKPNNGGPAFPVPDGAAADQGYFGMSLRDWFAGQALTGLLGAHAQQTYNGKPVQSQDQYAWMAYTMADAMLKARDETR